jgi:hypothetical protein
MSQQRREPIWPLSLVDGGGLDRGNLVLAKAVADNIEAIGKRRIAEDPVDFSGKNGSGW